MTQNIAISSLHEDHIIQRACTIWRGGQTSYAMPGSPFNEPLLRSLIQSIVEAINFVHMTATVGPVPSPASDSFTHLCCWDPSHGWIPVCQRAQEQAASPAPTCVACSGHAR